jgi:hypothetical protein
LPDLPFGAKEKATVSKVIDALIADEVIKIDPTGATILSKDDFVQVEGVMRITTASLAGRMFFIFRRLMDTAEGDLNTVFDFGVEDPEVVEQLKRVNLRNELLPIPMRGAHVGGDTWAGIGSLVRGSSRGRGRYWSLRRRLRRRPGSRAGGG